MKSIVVIVFMTMLGVGLTSQMRPIQVESDPIVSFSKKQVAKEIKVSLASPAVVIDTFKAAPVVVVTPTPAPTQSSPTSPNADKAFIYQHESGNRTDAVNEIGACGLGQALPCSKMGCSLSDYACQDSYFTQYMSERYGSWSNARAFWQSHSWW